MKITSVTVSTSANGEVTKLGNKLAMGYGHVEIQKSLDRITSTKAMDKWLLELDFYVHQIVVINKEGGMFEGSELVNVTTYHKLTK